MGTKKGESRGKSQPRGLGGRRPRADAQRNTDTLLEAAKAVFATSGVDVPVRKIADRAGVGIGTVYRHFPNRSDLVAAVFRREVDACAAAAASLANTHPPDVALSRWLHRYTGFIATKRGLAAALHSGEPAFSPLPTYFRQHLEPALKSLLDTAAGSGAVRGDIEPYELLQAVASLCAPAHGPNPAQVQRMVELLIDGLRYRGASKNERARSRK